MYFLSKVDIYLKHFISTGAKFFHETFWITKPVHKRCTKSAQKKAWSKIRTWDPGPGTLRPGTQDPETLRPGTLEPETLGLWDSDTQEPGNRSLRLGNCDSETQNPESRSLRIELLTQIPSILTRTTDWIKFNCEASFDNKKLGHLSQKLDLGAGVDGPKHLPKYFDIWHDTKKLENT